MIKFFRRIRQNLLTQNRFNKYILYAIGEIVLVVIGILIALQINNWNDKKRAIENSKVFLSEIKKDLASDTLYLNRAIINIQQDLDAKEWLLNKVSYELKDLDSILLSSENKYWDFYINDRTFQKIQNSKESKLIGYDSLNNSISKYYSIVKKRMEKNTEYEIRESTREDLRDDDLYNKLELGLPLSRVTNGKLVEKNFPSIQKDEDSYRIMFASLNIIKLRNDTKIDYARRSFILNGFVKCKEEADELIISINKALLND